MRPRCPRRPAPPGAVSDDVPHPDPAEIEALTAGKDGRRGLLDLLGFGGGEDEDDPGRRLLQDLQEGVPGLPGEHVGFVEDVDLETALLRRSVHGPFPEVPGIVHSSVGGGVDLHHIQGGLSPPDPPAAFALPAGLPVLSSMGAVQGHGQDPGQGGFPDSSGPAEEIGVADPVPGDGSPKGLGDVFLGRDLGEASWVGTFGLGQCGTRRRRSWYRVGCSVRKEMPQAPRSNDHRTYRCYLRGPDGIRRLSLCGPGALFKVFRNPVGRQAENGEKCRFLRGFRRQPSPSMRPGCGAPREASPPPRRPRSRRTAPGPPAGGSICRSQASGHLRTSPAVWPGNGLQRMSEVLLPSDSSPPQRPPDRPSMAIISTSLRPMPHVPVQDRPAPSLQVTHRLFFPAAPQLLLVHATRSRRKVPGRKGSAMRARTGRFEPFREEGAERGVPRGGSLSRRGEELPARSGPQRRGQLPVDGPGDDPDLVEEFLELIRVKGLGAIRQGPVRIRVDLHHQAVGPCRHGRSGHGGDLRPDPGPVARDRR